MDEQQHAESPCSSSEDAAPFPIVGIGASAGGLPALLRLLENMPAAPGMALVVVLHLAPDAPSTADKLLQRATGMPVVQVRDRMRLRPDHVYVISPGLSLKIEQNHLIADEQQCALGIPMTINIFFRTLGEAHGEQAIGIVLSGMGSDGVAGLASIKEHGGVTIAQLPGDAEESSMPQAAIDSGMVDFVLRAADIPAKLVEMRDAMSTIRQHDLLGNAPARETLDKVLQLLHTRTGHDFQYYKLPTILRRLERRMQVRGVPDLPAYLRLLQQDPREPDALLQDLLIGVTNFFRDRDAFDALEKTILPRIFHGRTAGEPLRAWVTACSTGEEAYSLGMLLAERIESTEGAPAMRIFATDVDERALAVARAGRYPEAIAADVPAERLARFFLPDDDHFRVRKLLRDHILFARHDLLHDPAFPNLDLITCRNVLIYLNREVQRPVLELFHCALKPGGYLLLGGEESADLAPDLFAAVDTHHRLYQAKPSANTVRHRPLLAADRGAWRQAAERIEAAPHGEPRMPSFAELHQRTLAQLAPPSVLVDAKGAVVHASDHVAAFLRYGGGEPSAQVLSLVLPSLRSSLRTVMFQARKNGSAARSGPIRYEQDGQEHAVSLSVVPVRDAGAGEGLVLVQFEPVEPAPAREDAGADAAGPRVRELEGALLHAQRNLQQTIERAEALQGTVDQLRAAVEELEINREDMQSRDEELRTVNAELQMRVEETSKANDDLSNLIASTDIATLFLDHRMRIQRYTPYVTRIYNIIPTDVGRPLAHITNRLETNRLLDEAAGVFTTLQPIERELRSTDGRDYIVRVHPYRTAYDRVEGAVMTFFDITSRRTAEKALRESEQRLAIAFAALPIGLGIVDVAGNTVMLNEVMRRFMPTNAIPSRDPARTARWRGWDGAGAPVQSHDFPGARALRGESVLSGMQMLYLDDDGQETWTEVRSAPLRDSKGNITGALVVVIDVDRLKRSEEEARRNAQRAESILEHMGDAHSVLDRDYRIVGVNAAAERLLGRPRAELLGRSHWDAFPGSVDAPVGRAFRRVVEEGVEQHLTHHYTGEGYDLHLEVDAYPTDEGGLAMFWRDVTERVRAELALRASEEKYRTLFNEMDEAYAVVEVMADAAGRWTDFVFHEVNPAFMRHTGMPYPVGRTATQLLGTPNPRWAELYGRAAQTGEPIRLEEAETTLGRVFDLNIFRLGGEGSRQVAVLFTDITERKRAEAAMRESEWRYRLLFENMSEGFALAELIRDEAGRPVDWRYLEVNAAWAQTGVAPAETVGRTAREVNPSIEPYWIETYGRVVETGQPVNLENWAEGLGKWFGTLAFKHSEDRFGLLFRDVTERHEADTALRASESRYRALFESIDEGFVVAELLYDEQGRAVDALYLEGNPAASRLTGVPDYTQRRFSEVVPGAEPYWMEVYDRVIRTGVAERLERYAAPLGRWYDVHVSRAANGRPGGEPSSACRVAIVFQEITARKHAEAALRESEARFRALAEASPALIWQIDGDAALSYVNQRCQDVTGASLDQLRGLGWHSVVHPGDAAGYLDAVARALREQQPMQHRVRVRRSDGSHHWFESHALPWYAADGQFRGMVGISIDVNEAVQAEEALKTADRRKDEFLATLAHELRNPLAPISNALQFLRHPGGKRRADRLLAMVERQVRHMVRLVDDLMEVTRISRGKVDLRCAPVTLAEVLNSAVETSLPAFEHKRQQLTVEATDETLRLDADKVRLTQVFANLLNNAAKYTAPGGQAWLTARRNGNEVLVTVRDTGMGIREEQLPLIFEMFSQPHGRDGHTDSGLGIGLAMVRSLVELHGGAVEAHSGGPGQGSEFVVRLPLADCQDAVPREADGLVEPSAAPLAGQRILVVDDNCDAADSLCQLLAARGADARAVYSGRAAIDAVEGAPPHAIVLDIGMPDMDGYEVARHIRQDRRADGIRIIALSGWGLPADRERSQACGFNHHLTKPAELDSLLRILSAT
jgi:two-component system CheB/CheR fusion protein